MSSSCNKFIISGLKISVCMFFFVEPVDGLFKKPKLVAVDYKNLRFV